MKRCGRGAGDLWGKRSTILLGKTIHPEERAKLPVEIGPEFLVVKLSPLLP
jgi:hypothetical protein